jgi:hypothetical protein
MEIIDSNWRRLAILALPVALAAIVLALLAAERASAAECKADFCTKVITEPDGRATLQIPGKLLRLRYPELQECTWKVSVEYGDGSPQGELTFSEAIGLEAEHTYPKPGAYTLNAFATEGVKEGTAEPCPDKHIEASVIFPEPAPPVEVPEESGKEVRVPGGGGPLVAPPDVNFTPGPTPVPRWRACGRGVRAHLVGCAKARKVIAAARGILSRESRSNDATVQASGFTCRRRGGSGSLSCRRGPQRVLGT